MCRSACVLTAGLLVVSLLGLPACRRAAPESGSTATQPTTMPAATQPMRVRRTRLRSGLSGAWKGRMECQTVQILGESRTQPAVNPLMLTVVFDENARPIRLPVVGFAGAPLEYVRISKPGESAEISSSRGNLTIASTVRIVAAEYRRDAFSVQMEIAYTGTAGALDQVGSGTQTIDGRVEEGRLKVTLNVQYTVTFNTVAGQLETGEEQNCTGVLAPR